MIPEGDLTPFALAMPDEYRPNHIPLRETRYGRFHNKGETHATAEEAVQAYRRYYHSKADSAGGVHYRHTSPPDWWMGVTA